MSIATTLRLKVGETPIPALRQELTALSEAEKKIKVNEPDQFGDTPLHIAAAGRNELLVKFLVSHGANVNAKNNAGSTPLHKAVLGGSKRIVEFLLNEQKAEWVENDSGFTPFTYARDILRDSKEFFFSLLSRETKTIVKDTMQIPITALPIVIGKGGRMLETLRATTQTDVEPPNKSKNSESNDPVELQLTGKSQEDIDTAKKRIEELIKRQEDDAKNNAIKKAFDGAAGGQFEEFKQKKEVKRRPEVPKPDQKNIAIIVKDIALNQGQPEKMRERFVKVPKDKHGLIVGKGKSNINRIEKDYGVKVIIPAASDPNATITLQGTNKESLEEAKWDIVNMLNRGPGGGGRGRGGPGGPRDGEGAPGGPGGQRSNGEGRQGGQRREGEGGQGRPYRRDQEESDNPKPSKKKPQQPLKINLSDASEWPSF